MSVPICAVSGPRFVPVDSQHNSSDERYFAGVGSVFRVLFKGLQWVLDCSTWSQHVQSVPVVGGVNVLVDTAM